MSTIGGGVGGVQKKERALNESLTPVNRELRESFDETVAGHTYSVGAMRCFLALRLSPIGGRATARALSIMSFMFPSQTTPSANGGQLWMLRMGLYELRRPKESATDWVWMIDHTIQAGQGKCLVVVGFRLSAWREKIAVAVAQDPQAVVALEQRDLSVWMLERVSSSSGAVVHEQLERLSQATGIVPMSLLSDQGADVRTGSEQFCAVPNRSTTLVHDISHAVANALKRQLAHCPRWAQFMADASLCKTQIRQTGCAFLMPPELKAKSRWMNLDPLVKWSRRVLEFLRNPGVALERAQVTVTVATVEQKMGWIRSHAESIAEWTRLLEAAATILKYIRQHGYHRAAPAELQHQLQHVTSAPARAMIEEVQEFVQTQSTRAGDHRLAGSTEVLESLIGTGKQLLGHTKNGYTKSILALAASVTDLTSQTVHTALAATPVKDVYDWIKTKLGPSLPAQRQLALPPQTTRT